MPTIICENGLCKYCLFNMCENKEIKKEFEDISLVTKLEIRSCKRYFEEEDLIDPHS